MGAAVLAGCDRSEELDVAATFLARVDSGKAGEAWEMLTDSDKAGMGREAFVALCTDSTRTRAYDTVLGTQEVSRGPDGVRVKQIRKVPDWDLVRSLRKPGRTLRELAGSLREGGNLRMRLDSSRTVTVTGKGAAARVSIGAGRQALYRRVLDSLQRAQLGLLEGRILSGDPRPNIGVWCNAEGEVRSSSETELSHVVFDVAWKGRPLGQWRVEKAVPPRGRWKGAIGIFYAEGMGPEKLPPSPLRGADFALVPVAAEPVDPNELRLQAQRLTGVEPLELF